MNSTPENDGSLILKTDSRGRVQFPWQKREKLLDEFEKSGLSKLSIGNWKAEIGRRGGKEVESRKIGNWKVGPVHGWQDGKRRLGSNLTTNFR